ncbi:hypothetical protein [Streptomyces sp. NPDC006463]|uniref:hypothetical protein n=1 Tax=Streptomyces sp. NPDC006463 TaxID=3364746 RepID=UPI003690B17F
MNPLLHGLAANPALPPELVDRLIELALAVAVARAGAETGTEAGVDTDPAGELLDALADRSDLRHDQVLSLAAGAEHTAVRLARDGKLTAADVDPVRQPLAALALLDEGAGRPEWARLLAADPDPRVRWRLASCPGLPPDVAQTLAADPDTGVVAELALWTTAAVTALLARHPHAEVRREAALNEATPPAALAALITGEGLAPAESCLVCDLKEIPFTHHPYCPDADCELRGGAECDGTHGSTVFETWERAVRNPATPPEAAVTFVDHPSMILRWALAERSDLPSHVYARLAEDPLPGVWEAVAVNPALDEELVRALATDDRLVLRRGLARHPRLPLDVLTLLATTTRLGPELLPRVASASPAEVAELAGSPHAAVRMLVAHRRDLPPRVRDALAADPDAAVVKAVAPHPGLSGEQLRAMVARHGVRVASRVAANPDAPGALLTELARHEPPVRRTLRQIAAHPNATADALLPALADARAGLRAAAHPALAPSVLLALLEDPDEERAEAAASNPALPPAVMEELVARYAGPGVTRPVS